MIRVRLAALAFLAAALLVGTATAADKPQKKARGGDAAQQLTRLLPEGAADKLKLTDEQKKQVDLIEEEYKAKTKEPAAKLKEAFVQNQEAIKKARQDKDKAAMQTALAPLREPFLEVRKLRDEYRDKVKAALNDEQKKTFEDALKEAPGAGGKLAQLLERRKKKDK